MRALLVAGVCVLLGASASGSTALGSTASGAAGSGAAASGSTASGAAASGSTMLQRSTGLTSSQVTDRQICAQPAPGHESCDAVALVNKSSGQFLHPVGGHPKSVSDSVRVGPATAVANGGPVGYTPQFMQQVYDTSWLSANSGSGETVAIVDAYGDPNAQSDLDTFRSTYGLPAISHSACTASTITTQTGGPCMVEVNQTGATSPLPSPEDNWDIEESLDLDAVSSLCPNCNILFIEADSSSYDDLGAANAEAVTLGAKLISDSWGAEWAYSDLSYSGGFIGMEEATGDTSGAETFASTGDDGTDGSEAGFPASEDYVTAVGGTGFALSNTTRGVVESAWDDAGSACPTFVPRPAWQSTTATGCSGRATADLSADAAPASGLDIYDSYQGGWLDAIGGTSLAAPLTTAFVAITGANHSSTADSDGTLSGEWAYADAAKLNDITGGSNGSDCSPTQLCAAGTGWDGPTGEGSISGDVVSSSGPSLTIPPDNGVDDADNGYSIVSALTSTTATFQGGVYPNGNTTSVWWEYGTGSATDNGTNFNGAQSTSHQSVGSGTAPVLASNTVATVSANTVYYVEECASNHSGSDTICGNVTEFTTGSGPDASGGATLADTSLGYGGSVRVGTQPTWSSTPTSTSYRWQESSDASSWSNVGSATSSPSDYTIAMSDSGKYLRVVIAATGSSATTTTYSNAVQVQSLVPSASAPTLSATSLGVGGVISVSTPAWTPAVSTSVSYQWQESSNGSSWSNVSGSTASTYTIASADSEKYIRVVLTGTNSAGSSALTSNSVQATNSTPTSTPTPTPTPAAAQNATVASAPRLSGGDTVGSTVSVSGGSYTNSGGVNVTFDRCARSCSTAQSGSSTSYVLRSADVGYYISASVTVAGSNGGASASAAASGMIGPVVSATAGALTINSANATVKGGKHVLLKVERKIVKPKSKKIKTETYELALTRAAGIKGTVKAWACVLSGTNRVSCTATVNVNHTAKLKFTVPDGDRVQLVAIQ